MSQMFPPHERLSPPWILCLWHPNLQYLAGSFQRKVTGKQAHLNGILLLSHWLEITTNRALTRQPISHRWRPHNQFYQSLDDFFTLVRPRNWLAHFPAITFVGRKWDNNYEEKSHPVMQCRKPGACSTAHRSNRLDHWDGLMLYKSAVGQLSSLSSKQNGSDCRWHIT